MNIGMQDAYNLTWKLALVLKGHARPSLLDTYDLEWKHVAEQLIDFDKKFATMFASKKNLNVPEFHDPRKRVMASRVAQDIITPPI